MKVYFATDHAGFELKQQLVQYVQDELGHEVIDLGADHYDPEDDYPDFMKPAAEAVSGDADDRAILLGGSGQGEAMVANRVPGARATVYYGGPEEIITLSREHNDANILSLGARFLDIPTAKKVVALWLATPFSEEERHIRRITQIEQP
jgi:ribose 5-phosphate isomerase B